MQRKHRGKNIRAIKPRAAETIDLKVKSYYGKMLHQGKYNINNNKQMQDMFYYLHKVLNIDITKLMRQVKARKEKA